MLIPFQQPATSPDSIDDTNLIQAWDAAGDAVPLLIKLGKIFEREEERVTVDAMVEEMFSKGGVKASIRVKRVYTILLFFSLKVIKFACYTN